MFFKPRMFSTFSCLNLKRYGDKINTKNNRCSFCYGFSSKNTKFISIFLLHSTKNSIKSLASPLRVIFHYFNINSNTGLQILQKKSNFFSLFPYNSYSGININNNRLHLIFLLINICCVSISKFSIEPFTIAAIITIFDS